MENSGGQNYSLWSQERFIEELWNIYPEGDKDWVYSVMCSNVKNMNFTFEQIRDKFQEYINSLAPHQNGKYTPKEKRIKPLEDFINEGLYKKDFAKEINKTNPLRDSYLYGI